MRPDYRRICPSGANTYSKAPDRWPQNAPRKAIEGYGPWVRCDDGQRYVDCTSALGAILLGHRNRVVNEAVEHQLRRGVSFSLPTEIEHELAWRLVQLVPGAEMCRFGKNGTDVVNAAVRLSRAHTEREIVLRTGYHGHADWAVEPPMDGGVVGGNSATVRVPPNDLDALEKAISRQVAAFVMEPIATHDPVVPTAEYMRGVRALCDRYDVVWIMDEMVTGFRTGWPGAVANYDVSPNLWCGAKALGNGFPITALLGGHDIMRRLERDVFYSTTFAGETVSIAAALACLDEMQRVDVAAEVDRIGRKIQEVYRLAALRAGLESETEVIGYPARPVFRWYHRSAEVAFLETMVSAHVLCQGYINIMLAHAEVLDALTRAIQTGMVAARTVVEAQDAAASHVGG